MDLASHFFIVKQPRAYSTTESEKPQNKIFNDKNCKCKFMFIYKYTLYNQTCQFIKLFQEEIDVVDLWVCSLMKPEGPRLDLWPCYNIYIHLSASKST